MAVLTIPDKYRSGITKIKSLSEEAIKELSDALENAPPSLKSRDLVNKISTSITLTNDQDIHEIIKALTSLYRLQADSDTPIEELAGDVANAMKSLDDKGGGVSNEDNDKFKFRLISLLGFESLVIASKASALQTDHEHIFCSAKIYTDLRPVFGSTPESAPVGGVIVHMLKVGYHKSGSHKEFYIALDTNDLSQLKTKIERAEIKSKALSTSFENLGLKCIDLP